MNKGFFLVFEGIDGSGKTTQAGLLKSFLSGKGHRVVLTRDPGGTSLGESLRKLLLYEPAPVDPEAELFLYAAARAQLAAGIIRPALREGAVVISDRFADSTRAYQGSGRGMDRGLVELVAGHSCRGLGPDLTVVLDLDPAGAAARMVRPADRMEREGIEFLRRVRKGYLDLAARRPGRYLVLDASLPEDRLFSLVSAAVEEKMGLAKG